MTAIDLEFCIQKELKLMRGNTEVLTDVLNYMRQAVERCKAESLRHTLKAECQEAILEMEDVKAGRKTAHTMQELYEELEKV